MLMMVRLSRLVVVNWLLMWVCCVCRWKVMYSVVYDVVIVIIRESSS